MYISIGMFLISVGGIIFILPVLMKSNQSLNVTINSHLCIENDIKKAELEDPNQALYLSLMYISFALIGIGSAPLFTIAIKYIFETFSEERTPIFNSIFGMCQMLGTMIVFVFSKFILKIHIFPWKNNHPKITQEQETWVGAYWLIYLVGSVILFVLMIINLILTRINTRLRQIETHTNNQGPSYSISEFIKCTMGIIRDVKLFVIIVSYAFLNLAKNSLGNYVHRYAEIQFHVSSGKASLYAGASAVFSTIIGLYISSILMKKYRQNNKALFIINISTAIISLISLMCAQFYCKSIDIKGLEIKGIIIKNFSPGYSKTCHCKTEDYFPVCVDNSHTVYSPCILGCKNHETVAGIKNFKNCTHPLEFNGKGVIQGKCPKKCSKFFIFIFLGNISVFLICLSSLTTLQLTMNLSESNSFDVALGFRSTIARILLIIGPLIYGSLFDSACTLRRPILKNAFVSNCIQYNQGKLAILFIGFSSFLTLIYIIGHIFIYFLK
ncbi:Solute carrier organic anion transporter family member 5A1 [Thelohanellus kitauei]|uniref:Solute carrier organic anion transporter family member 5A1 n=1 Tax=Thelohanellus kitauei TaxID=669202 RepID=A0A0C2MUH8_THEKT|nr:Solute carrier organic anion transporter family member 5A1 [Thelohanellus kitauei]